MLVSGMLVQKLSVKICTCSAKVYLIREDMYVNFPYRRLLRADPFRYSSTLKRFIRQLVNATSSVHVHKMPSKLNPESIVILVTVAHVGLRVFAIFGVL